MPEGPMLAAIAEPDAGQNAAQGAGDGGAGSNLDAGLGDGGASPSCAPLDPKTIAPYATCDTKVVKNPLPDIIDAAGSMRSFYEKLAALERGVAPKPVRIAIYGDSNLTSDFLPGQLRRVLQARYGDAGHGYVALSRPWLSYRHEDVSMGGYWGPNFTYCSPTTNLCHDKHYGFANLASETNELGAAVWAGTTKTRRLPLARRFLTSSFTTRCGPVAGRSSFKSTRRM